MKRRKILVDPKYQLPYGMLLFSMSGVGGVITAAVIQYAPSENVTGLLVGIFSALAIFSIWLGVHLTHRVAGPLIKLRNTFDEVTAGNHFVRIKFRPRDDFQDIATKFNEMMESIQEHFRK